MSKGGLRKITGKNIRKIRLQKKLTQENAAEIAGFHYKYFQRIEAGGVNLRLDSLEKIAKAFKVEVKSLFSS